MIEINLSHYEVGGRIADDFHMPAQSSFQHFFQYYSESQLYKNMGIV